MWLVIRSNSVFTSRMSFFVIQLNEQKATKRQKETRKRELKAKKNSLSNIPRSVKTFNKTTDTARVKPLSGKEKIKISCNVGRGGAVDVCLRLASRKDSKSKLERNKKGRKALTIIRETSHGQHLLRLWLWPVLIKS